MEKWFQQKPSDGPWPETMLQQEYVEPMSTTPAETEASSLVADLWSDEDMAGWLEAGFPTDA
jgi:hypothetical protein